MPRSRCDLTLFGFHIVVGLGEEKRGEEERRGKGGEVGEKG